MRCGTSTSNELGGMMQTPDIRVRSTHLLCQPGTMTPDNLRDRRNLDKRFAAGLAWTAGAKWATQVLTWLSVLAVARASFSIRLWRRKLPGCSLALRSSGRIWYRNGGTSYAGALDRRTSRTAAFVCSMLLHRNLWDFGVVSSWARVVFRMTTVSAFCHCRTRGFLLQAFRRFRRVYFSATWTIGGWRYWKR